VKDILQIVPGDFAHATAVVLYVMCGIMALAAAVALFGLQRGRQEVAPVEDVAPAPGAPAAPA
jgi:type IV secretory pathway VirB2 component (pilin)